MREESRSHKHSNHNARHCNPENHSHDSVRQGDYRTFQTSSEPFISNEGKFTLYSLLIIMLSIFDYKLIDTVITCINKHQEIRTVTVVTMVVTTPVIFKLSRRLQRLMEGAK